MKSKVSLKLIINGESYSLNTNKLLIGSAENADIKIQHDSISHYHAMAFIENNTAMILDLESQNGTYINGVNVGTKHALFDGDTLSLGKVHCELIETNEVVEFANQDGEVQVYEELQAEKVYVPAAANENEILIDDEYCDVIFDDSNFETLNSNPLLGFQIDKESYVETEEFENSFNMVEQSDGQCIQVTTSLNGSMLEQYYYPIADGVIKASNKEKKGHVVVDILNSEKPIPLFNVQDGVISLSEVEDFNLSQTSMNLTDNKVLVLSRGTYQVFIETSNVPNKLIHISSLRRDKAFIQDTAKKFAAVILPMLLLLLVDFTIEMKKPIKELSIIYKKPTKATQDNKKMASTNPNDTKKNTGHKSTKQPDKKIAHRKSGKKSQPKKSAQKKVAKSAAKKPASKAKAKTKAYNFKMATNVNSLFNTSKSVAVANSNSASTVKTTSSVSGSLSTKVNGTSSNAIGNMGSDSAGRAAASMGSKGLSSKSGRDTAYIQTETVVLGSMDPELLRKILQQYLPQFRHCYQQELAYNSDDIKGIVDLNFEISATGKVGKIKVRAKDSRFSKKGTNCMADVLAIIDFPKPKGGGRVAVRQPLSFFSEKENS